MTDPDDRPSPRRQNCPSGKPIKTGRLYTRSSQAKQNQPPERKSPPIFHFAFIIAKTPDSGTINPWTYPLFSIA
jgi:hypothetical protein